MNLTKCAKGHYYDAAENASCPHCNITSDLSKTAEIKADKATPSGGRNLIKGKYDITQVLGQDNNCLLYRAINVETIEIYLVQRFTKYDPDYEYIKAERIAYVNKAAYLNFNSLPDVDWYEDNKSFYFFIKDDINDSLKTSRAFCRDLATLHMNNPTVILSQLEPSFVCFTKRGRVYDVRFGFNEFHTTDTDKSKAPVGLERGSVSSDIYFFGGMLYKLLTGKHYSSVLRNEKLFLPEGLQEILFKCIEENPENRFSSCAELEYALYNLKEYDPSYHKLQKKKLLTFELCSSMTIIFFIIGIIGTLLS